MKSFRLVALLFYKNDDNYIIYFMELYQSTYATYNTKHYNTSYNIPIVKPKLDEKTLIRILEKKRE
jgi:hypothetical protein